METYLVEILAGIIATLSALLIFYLSLRNDRKKKQTHYSYKRNQNLVFWHTR